MWLLYTNAIKHDYKTTVLSGEMRGQPSSSMTSLLLKSNIDKRGIKSATGIPQIRKV